MPEQGPSCPTSGKLRRWIRTVAHMTECAHRVRGVFKRQSPALREPDSAITVVYRIVSGKNLLNGTGEEKRIFFRLFHKLSDAPDVTKSCRQNLRNKKKKLIWLRFSGFGTACILSRIQEIMLHSHLSGTDKRQKNRKKHSRKLFEKHNTKYSSKHFLWMPDRRIRFFTFSIKIVMLKKMRELKSI